jgi:hypothetical protein
MAQADSSLKKNTPHDDWRLYMNRRKALIPAGDRAFSPEVFEKPYDLAQVRL